MSSEAEAVFQHLIDKYYGLASGALFKEPAELTDAERVCLAFLAGCEMDFSWEGDKFKMRTKNPVGFAKPYPNQPIRVYENRAIKPGDQVLISSPPANPQSPLPPGSPLPESGPR